jgi:hypothetical protein
MHSALFVAHPPLDAARQHDWAEFATRVESKIKPSQMPCGSPKILAIEPQNSVAALLQGRLRCPTSRAG